MIELKESQQKNNTHTHLLANKQNTARMTDKMIKNEGKKEENKIKIQVSNHLFVND